MMTMSFEDSEGSSVESIIFERVVGSLGASIYTCTEENGYAGSLDEDEDWDEGCLQTQSPVHDVRAVGGENGPDSGADLGLGRDLERLDTELEMAPPPSSPKDASDPERWSAVESTLPQ